MIPRQPYSDTVRFLLCGSGHKGIVTIVWQHFGNGLRNTPSLAPEYHCRFPPFLEASAGAEHRAILLGEAGGANAMNPSPRNRESGGHG